MRIDIETGIVTGGPPPLRHARTKGGKHSNGINFQEV